MRVKPPLLKRTLIALWHSHRRDAYGLGLHDRRRRWRDFDAQAHRLRLGLWLRRRAGRCHDNPLPRGLRGGHHNGGRRRAWSRFNHGLGPGTRCPRRATRVTLHKQLAQQPRPRATDDQPSVCCPFLNRLRLRRRGRRHRRGRSLHNYRRWPRRARRRGRRLRNGPGQINNGRLARGPCWRGRWRTAGKGRTLPANDGPVTVHTGHPGRCIPNARAQIHATSTVCLLYTSDAADD